MATLDDRIAAKEKQIAELQSKMRELKVERKKRERAEKREAERQAREQEQKDALVLWRLLHESTVTFDGNKMNAYTFIENNVLPKLVTVEDDTKPDSE